MLDKLADIRKSGKRMVTQCMEAIGAHEKKRFETEVVRELTAHNAEFTPSMKVAEKLALRINTCLYLLAYSNHGRRLLLLYSMFPFSLAIVPFVLFRIRRTGIIFCDLFTDFNAKHRALYDE